MGPSTFPVPSIPTDLDIPFLLLLEVLVGSLVGLLLHLAQVEVAGLQLLGLAQSLLGMPPDLWRLGVLVYEVGYNLPSLVRACCNEVKGVSCQCHPLSRNHMHNLRKL